MKVLLKNIRIVNGQKIERGKKDIFIKKGKIAAIGKTSKVERGIKVIDADGAYCSPSWIDVGVQACDPGYEHREDLRSLSNAAEKGGFGALAIFPNTNPCIQSQSEISYIHTKAQAVHTKIHCIGALSTGCKGEDLAELYDMAEAGALAFSDGYKSIRNAGLLSRALKYSQAFNGLIFDFPQEYSTSKTGQMHEGALSTSLGMRGIPVLSEVLAIQRDIELLAYTGGRLHLHLVSSAEGVELIRAAKAKGLNVSCSTAIANTCFTEEELSDFDSQWKLSPPLRSISDKNALVEGLKDGTIDFLCSNHVPWDIESKNLEFPYAEFGMLGLQTALPLTMRFLKDELSIPQLVQLWAINARKVMGLEIPKIEVGADADLTVFKKERWIFDKKDIVSKSKNSPFIGWGFEWKVCEIPS